MSEARFTKGPWQFMGLDEIYADDGETLIAEVAKEHAGNAFLIAAAPDGYGFADAFIEYVRRSDLDDLDFGRGLQDSGLIEQAQAFLSKARGVQP